MYLEHFGLSQAPFTLTPNTAFFLDQGSYREALNVVLVALAGGEGFVKITGEVGTGKTLLCRRLLAALDENWVTAYIPNPSLTAVGLRHALADELGVEMARNSGQQRVLKAINERLLELAAAGKHVVLIVDEAQTMPDDSLEAVRLLGNLETESSKLLQVVLFGQPELDERLAQPRLRQLRQRIGFSYRLHPLPPAVLPRYVEFRLQAAGYSGEPVFERGALRALARASRGVPRLVNILAHKALLAAFGEGAYRVARRHVLRAVADTEDAAAARRLWWPTTFAGLAATGLAAWLLVDVGAVLS
jgi:MSHA biogenesis protein MshM